MIDGLEDRLGSGEKKRLDDLVSGLRQWEAGPGVIHACDVMSSKTFDPSFVE
jgi:hypothetical protein